jgi:hypothetical protein
MSGNNVNKTVWPITARCLGTFCYCDELFIKLIWLRLRGWGWNFSPPWRGGLFRLAPALCVINFSLFDRSWHKCFNRVIATKKENMKHSSQHGTIIILSLIYQYEIYRDISVSDKLRTGWLGIESRQGQWPPHSDPEAHPISYRIGTRRFISWSKEAAAWNWQLISI